MSALWCPEHLGLPRPALSHALSHDLSSGLARLPYIAAQVVREQKHKLPVLLRPKPGTIAASLKSHCMGGLKNSKGGKFSFKLKSRFVVS